MNDDPIFDRFLACLLLPVVLPVLALLYVLVVASQGRPFLYVSERMRDADTAFSLLKIRTMQPCPRAGSESVLGGEQRNRVTAIGRLLRRTRVDELPQIFNVLRGDMRFVGPRPPLRRHVAACPQRYRRLLTQSRPGITGLATVMVHAREERLLAACASVDESEAVYIRRCLPLKLRLDMIYQKNRSLRLDALIFWRTFSRLFPERRHADAVVDRRNALGTVCKTAIVRAMPPAIVAGVALHRRAPLVAEAAAACLDHRGEGDLSALGPLRVPMHSASSLFKCHIEPQSRFMIAANQSAKLPRWVWR